jgi:hypothetical protein
MAKHDSRNRLLFLSIQIYRPNIPSGVVAAMAGVNYHQVILAGFNSRFINQHDIEFIALAASQTQGVFA